MTFSDEPAVFIVDDDAAVRESLRALLGSVDVRAHAFASAEEFLAVVDQVRRGCLLIDVRMPGMSGLELQRTLQERGIDLPVILITGHGDVPMAVRAMKAGAVDFIEKPFNEQELLERVQGCLKADAELQQVRAAREDAFDRIGQLTQRELEVMELLVVGKPSKLIASALGISEKTVDVHRFNVMRKTGMRSVAELVQLWALVRRSRN
jgi:FixJ family two-component response regulator